MTLAGKCRVRGDCGCKHDTVDSWLLGILQDLAIASYSCHSHSTVTDSEQSFGPTEVVGAQCMPLNGDLYLNFIGSNVSCQIL